MSKKLSIVNVHDYPSFAQYEFAKRARDHFQGLNDWSRVAAEMRDDNNLHADPRGCELAASKWGDAKAYYTVYWEIGMTQHAPFHWHVRFISYEHSTVVAERTGHADTMDEARRASQQYVLDHIEEYRVEAVR